MNSHPDEHAELLARLAAGELAADDAAVRERLAACAQCRAEYAAVRALAQDLCATFAGAAAFADARAATTPADAALVRHTLEQVLAERRETRAPRPRRWWPVLLAAALLAALALSVRFLGGPAPERVPEILLSDGLTCDAPRGSSGGYPEFRWHLAPGASRTTELPPEGHYELTISRHGPEGAGEPLLDTIRTTEPRWTPTPEQAALLTEEIHWSVTAFDGLGDPFASGSASASR